MITINDKDANMHEIEIVSMQEEVPDIFRSQVFYHSVGECHSITARSISRQFRFDLVCKETLYFLESFYFQRELDECTARDA